MRLGSDRELHLRFCATRDWTTAVLLILFCGQWTWVAWRELHAPLPVHHEPASFLIIYAVGCIIAARLLAILACPRERLVLSLYLLGLAWDLARGAFPNQLWFFVPHAPEVYLSMSLAATLVSVSLLCSGLSRQRRGNL